MDLKNLIEKIEECYEEHPDYQERMTAWILHLIEAIEKSKLFSD